MGKSLKGKELGKGIGQRKDGLYYARCTDKAGQRLERCFQMLTEVKPMHCKAVFNGVTGTYAGSTIRQAYIALGAMFKAAKENELIEKHPMDGVRFDSPVKAVDEIRFLTVSEQKAFLKLRCTPTTTTNTH